MKLAILDLGTNSLRFDIYEVARNMSYRCIYRDKIMVRLGDGVFETGELSSLVMNRASAALEGIREKIRAHQVDHVRAVATSALRSAKNAEAFVREMKRKTGIALEIISGEEEAELIAKGVLRNEILPEGLTALVDIGGGSTEISLCFKHSVLAGASFPLGANRLQQVFLKTIPPQNGAASMVALREHVRQVLQPFFASSPWPPVDSAMGSSGSIRSIAKILRKMNLPVEPFRRKDLSDLVSNISAMGRSQLCRIPGLEPRRTDLFLAGALLFDEILQVFSIKKVYTTAFSLRDGLLENELEILARRLTTG